MVAAFRWCPGGEPVPERNLGTSFDRAQDAGIACSDNVAMKEASERTSVLALVDAVLTDLAVRSAMYVARPSEDGDARTFVVQTGEEGRLRLDLPDPGSDASVMTCVAAAQSHLEQVLGVPVPLCPVHDHALVGVALGGSLRWLCPNGLWECALGDYEEQTWPQMDVSSLAPILSRRLRRRGAFPAVRSIGVARSGEELVADFGVAEATDELLWLLAEVAAPLQIKTHESPHTMIRVSPLARRDAGPAATGA